MQPQDGCLRDYALSDWDLYLLSGADMVIAGGRGLESFESTLQSLGASGPVVALTLYNTELYGQDEEAADGEENDHFTGANPHLYMGIDGAKYILEGAASALAKGLPMCYNCQRPARAGNTGTWRTRCAGSLCFCFCWRRWR